MECMASGGGPPRRPRLTFVPSGLGAACVRSRRSAFATCGVGGARPACGARGRARVGVGTICMVRGYGDGDAGVGSKAGEVVGSVVGRVEEEEEEFLDEDDSELGEEEEDDEVFGYEIETDEEDDVPLSRSRGAFDEDGVPVGGNRVRARSSSRGEDLGLGGVDVDEDDDVLDFEESQGDVLDVAISGTRTAALKDEEEEDEIEDVDDFENAVQPAAGRTSRSSKKKKNDADEADDLFDESENDLRTAAEALGKGGMLGLGVDGGARSDSSELASFAMGEDLDLDDTPPPPPKSRKKIGRPPGPSKALRDLPGLVKRAEETTAKDSDDDSPFPDDEFADPSMDDDTLGGPKNLDDYVDVDELDDEAVEFGVTTATSFGRVWELNDDAYVTITEPGQAYAYDVDEGDREDQEMATVRRGRAGGWGGGLQNDAAFEAPEGSKEWIARKAYDLMTKANRRDMFLWTRARRTPPSDISSLFPKEPAAPPPFGPTELDTSGLDADGQVEREGVGLLDDQGLVNRAVGAPGEAGQSGHVAIERAVDFPCMYKFKVVGSGDEFVESLTRDMEAVLGRQVPPSAFKFEDAGRLQRIIVNVEVDSAQQVTDLYDAVRLHPGVKFSYG